MTGTDEQRNKQLENMLYEVRGVLAYAAFSIPDAGAGIPVKYAVQKAIAKIDSNLGNGLTVS